MPAGHRKEIVRGVAFDAGSPSFVMRAPLRRVGANIQIAWHLSLVALPAGSAIIESCGDGATRGWLLEILPSGAAQFSIFNGGAGGVATSTNVLTAADIGLNFMVIASIAGTNMLIYLNETPTAAVSLAAMVEPNATEDLELADTSGFGTEDLHFYRRWQTHTATPSVLSLATLYRRTRLAIRLEEPAACVSYIDFGRYLPELFNGTFSFATGHFGDDCTGARVEMLVASGAPAPACEIRADRAADWSTA